MPITRLSKANLKRARSELRSSFAPGGRYHKLSWPRKNKILFDLAWKIQRGHVRKYGHR